MGTNSTANDEVRATEVRGDLRKKSKFFRRLESHKSEGALRLASAVVTTVRDAEAISQHVVRFFPQYTLHQSTHQWNVLGWMERLARPAIKQLGPLDCALAIQAAFIHDLGMVPPEDEQRALRDPDTPAGRAFQSYCDGHPLYAELQRLQQLRTGKIILGYPQEELLRGQLLADYLRASHADERAAQGHNRILGWLKKLRTEKNELTHHGLSYQPLLALLAISHGQAIDWLPARLMKGPNGLDEKVNVHAHELADEHVHWTQIAWLLRLADIMDFDATRTPKAVFEHLGIVNPKSREEWLKHLSVPSGPHATKVASPLKYSVGCCPSPRIEKALRQYCQWIDDQLRGVRDQLEALRPEDRLPLALPSEAKVIISTREGGYCYEDLEMRLDRDAIVELLMGETLYGEPELALRELVQNALDALHLRDLRDRLRAALEGEPEKSLVRPVARIGRNEKLKVEVQWGEDEKGAFIKVRDNGVGMTREDITRYLTRIGTSYYKSCDYEWERALMRRVLKEDDAELASMSPISQFGIGFLSCFMLADRITVHTRAAEETLRVEIDGPHGFIALYPDRGKVAPNPSGTEVTLRLKPGLKLAPFDERELVRRLRKDLFGIYPEQSNLEPEEKREEGIEPAFAIARYVLWPLYPVNLQTPGSTAASVSLDPEMTFLRQRLLPLDGDAIRRKAAEWEIDPALFGNPVWDPYTWRHAEKTGSGVRILVPRSRGTSRTGEDWLQLPDSDSARAPQWVLNAFAEVQLPTGGRTCVLVNGIRIPTLHVKTRLGHGVGALCFMDLRGPARPRLRADRKASVGRPDAHQEAALDDFQQQALVNLAPKSQEQARWRCHSITGNLVRPLTGGTGSRLLDPPEQLRIPVSAWISLNTSLCRQELSVAGARDCHRDLDLGLLADFGDDTFDDKCERAVTLALNLPNAALRPVQAAIDVAHILGRNDDRLAARAGELDFRLVCALDPNADHDHALTRARAQVHDLEADLAQTRAVASDAAVRIRPVEHWRRLLGWHLLSEALWPDLNRCFAPLSTGLAGPVGSKWLAGPLTLHEPRPEQSQPVPKWLRDYDLVAPLTAIPLNTLRQEFPAWREERVWRTLLMLPFLLFLSEVPPKWRRESNCVIETLGVDSMMLLMPDPERFLLSFADGTEADWDGGSASAIWSIREGTVLWASGIHTRKSLRAQGEPLTAFLPRKGKRSIV